MLSSFVFVSSSFWPLILSLSIFRFLVRFFLWVNLFVSIYFPLLSLIRLLLVSLIWWKDLVREGILGFHTFKLDLCFRVGIFLFILSEVFFFVSFFWAFFDSSLVPTCEVGIIWPPKGISVLSPYSVPLLNTLILLSRGVSLTWAHHSIISNKYISFIWRILLTIFLGIYFLYIQYSEYIFTRFSFTDGIYGRTFFLTTGFHGFHVLVGFLFLSWVLFISFKGRFIYNHHFSFEASAWYWHFVDVVWLILFISFYWWGSL